jgi:hypothetical protein
MTDNPLYLVSTKGARRVWPVSRGCLLLHGTWSYLRIFWQSVLPYNRFCICLLDCDYFWHIVNFAILYLYVQEKPVKYPSFNPDSKLVFSYFSASDLILMHCLAYSQSGNFSSSELLYKLKRVFMKISCKLAHSCLYTSVCKLYTYLHA